MHHDHAVSSGHGLLDWFSGYGYAPHSGCFLGDTGWVAAYVLANWIIAVAYALVAMLIYQRMRRASHIPRTLMGMSLLGIFVTCSFGHFLAGYTTVAWPGYRLETLWHWWTAVPAWIFLAHHRRFSLIVEGPHMITESRDELARKNNELSLLYARVKEIDELKSQFFANVSHELRTPLALILGPVDNLLKSDTLPDATRRDLNVVRRNARTLLHHVGDLLDFSRLEAGKMSLHYADMDLAKTLSLLAGNFEGVADEHRLTLLVEKPDSLPLQADVDKVQRVILNLLSNAIKFTPEGGTIRCAVTTEGDDVLLTVQDNGPGVPSDLREAIFERFRQGEGGATRRFGGTGLGLAISKEFVELHGGRIWVEDAPGGGARFVVRLPRRAPAGTPIHAAPEEMEAILPPMLEAAAPKPTAPAPRAGNGGLVLVVEDNPDMSHFLCDTLATDYRVEAATNGREGLEKALTLRPDLILSDIMMPEMSGDQLVWAARQRTELEDIPILLLTAKADDTLRVRLLQEGAQDFLTKPFNAEELRARARNLIMMKRARQILQEELAERKTDLETLASEVAARKRELQTALEEATDARNAAQQSAQRAEKAAARVRDLQTVTDATLTHLSLQDLMHELLSRIRDLLAADTCAIFLPDESGQELVLCAAQGYDGSVEAGLRLPMGEAVAGRVAQTQQPLIVSGRVALAAMHPVFRDTGLQAVVDVPMLLEGRLTGVLHIGAITARQFTEEDVQLLQLVADRIAHAVERSRLFQFAQERNEKLGQAIQEVHHRIKNNLQSVSALLEMQMNETMDALPVEAIRESLRQIKAIALVHDLLSRDQPITTVDAAAALRNLVTLLQDSLRLPGSADVIRLEVESLWLPMKVVTSLALIVNELVSNAFKHGNIQEFSKEHSIDSFVTIRLFIQGEDILLHVDDAGPGFPPDFDPQRDAHIGLELVATLVRADLQGRLAFGLRPEARTDGERSGGRVTIRFPRNVQSA